jgi:hypothetical protein
MTTWYQRYERDKRAGYIYIVGSTTEHKFKFGMTMQSTPEERMRTVALSVNFFCNVRIAWSTDDCYAEERSWHTTLTSRALGGEWFALDEEDLSILLNVIITFPNCYSYLADDYNRKPMPERILLLST